MLLVCSRSYLQSVLRYKYLILISIIRTLYISVSKDVRIRGYFEKPKGVRDQTGSGKPDLENKNITHNWVCIREVRASNAGRSTDCKELHFPLFFSVPPHTFQDIALN